jgi:tRNA nucleotidyltransferase (CCA-adding enzyme)
MKQLPPPVLKALHAIANAGGTPYIVGGAARDYLLTKDSFKDLDVEVFNLPGPKLLDVLSQFGQVHRVGASFGVYSLREVAYNGLPVEFAIPRSIEFYLHKHNDVTVELDPFLDFRTASMRRDLTINSMGIKFPEGTLEDWWGGQRDWIRRVARPVNPWTFSDDHLRVLRAAQFCARWGLKPHGLLVDLASTMTQEHLSAERVHSEWQKMLMKGISPAAGLNFLMACGWLRRFYPELYQLAYVHQSPKWHPEGTVWEHTCDVVNYAAAMKMGLAEDWRAPFMYAALTHDIGKIEYTKWVEKKQDWQSGGHPASMLPLIVLEQITPKKTLLKRAMWLVKNHDRRIGLQTARPGKFTAFARQLQEAGEDATKALIHLWTADTMGSRSDDSKEVIQKLHEAIEIVEKTPIPITGRDIINELGVKPGPEVGVLIRKATDIFNEEVMSREELLEKLKLEMDESLAQETAS